MPIHREDKMVGDHMYPLVAGLDPGDKIVLDPYQGYPQVQDSGVVRIVAEVDPNGTWAVTKDNITLRPRDNGKFDIVNGNH